ncbi:MAG: haloalkane dehalogenase [Myxococcales bacterium]|nr:haloalkane dehalogenase [Myxococcales bacterium]
MSVISADFPFESRFVDVHGSQIHYVEQGEGSPILLLHGNPTSSYLWRNVIPHISGQGRVIAMDLIGMGRSHKPDIDYRFVDHYRFVQGFIEALRLQHVTLVLHEWGSALGFHYAMTHESNVKGIAFMEAILEPVASLEAMPEAARELFVQLRDEDEGIKLAIDQNFFVETMLPASVMRDLTRRELEAYRAPFVDPASRKPLWRWPNELPIAGEPADVAEIITGYGNRLRQSEVPKLLLHATPGALITPPVAEQLQADLPNLTAEHVGDGIHFLPEDVPAEIGAALSKWLRAL